MNMFDIIITALLLFGFIRGLVKGLFVELASLLSLIAGVYGAIHFSYFVGDFLKDSLDWDEQYIAITAFAITFIAIVIVISLLGKLFTKIANFAALGALNKILGGVFGALKFGLILSIVLIIFDKLNKTIPFVTEENTEDSILYEPVKELAPLIFSDFLTVEDLNLDNIKSTSKTKEGTI